MVESKGSSLESLAQFSQWTFQPKERKVQSQTMLRQIQRQEKELKMVGAACEEWQLGLGTALWVPHRALWVFTSYLLTKGTLSRVRNTRLQVGP